MGLQQRLAACNNLSRKVDLSGLTFGRLKVIEKLPTAPSEPRKWKCHCSCGNETIVTTSALLHSKTPTRSCGCLWKEKFQYSQLTHGDSYSNAYRSYKNLMNACYNSTAASYPSVGGMGIKSVWDSYEEFKRDMLDSYFPGAVLTRIDCSKDYCKENCLWVTKEQNHKNLPKTRKARKEFIQQAVMEKMNAIEC